jgi:hypothetical protein
MIPTGRGLKREGKKGMGEGGSKKVNKGQEAARIQKQLQATGSSSVEEVLLRLLKPSSSPN